MQEIQLTDIMGINIGHAQDLQAGTGCSVVIAEQGCIAGVDVRGGAPGTRETDLLSPVNMVDRVHAILLTGGSAFGLDAASGVMRFLEERGAGFDVQVTTVPIVCGAALFDLTFGSHTIRPDGDMGYAACKAAMQGNNESQGNVGAGTGATVGKIKGIRHAMKGGLGCHGVQIGKLQVGAMVAVNCLGDVVDTKTGGEKLAGVLSDGHQDFSDTEAIMMEHHADLSNLFSGNTTIGVIVTNATLNKAQATKIAGMAQNGFARSIRPAHTMFDGDTIFCLSTGKVQADISTVGLLAARVMENAVINGVREAETLHGVPSHKDLLRCR